MDDYLNDMALFVEVVKANGFRNAAEAVGIPNSTLSRRISALERTIGLRLLHRTTRRIELTEAGQIYFERCKRIVDEARLAHEQLGEMLAQPSGVLRVSLPVDFAVTYLAPLIADFAGLYPGITFDFDVTPRRVDLVSEPFDVAIRIGESASSQLIARALTSLTPCLYASPGYLERAGEPEKPSDLERHACLSILKADTWTLHEGKRTVTVSVGGRFSLNSVGMIRRLATLDMGIVLMPQEVVAAELESGALRPVMPGWRGAPIPVYVITETRLLPAKTQRFIEFLQERLTR
ncbi:MAG: LysR family transcriptional regulator [Paraburkholderia sp.]|uniref:LysR family transcriptional regulator n=1 Tax=Paraburkholderia sp. TaxID=1926495 RepID=UPI001219AC4E|nr:LysR family transcriptional regulator [Paraburkholderia sp.]TAM02333.1 MAG: LysR family transcriptional regulator [Paraburkholderia sp.]